MKTIYKFTVLALLFLLFLNGTIIKAQTYNNKPVKYGRVYYDFEKKQLYKNVYQKDLLIRPLLVKEGKEIQMVITKFNPLKYSIIIEDTAYDMFSSNMDDFMKLIKMPDISFPGVGEKGANGNEDSIQVCQHINALKNTLTNLDSALVAYNDYIKSLNHINDVYLTAKKLKTFSPADIRTFVKDSITDKINEVLPDTLQLLQDKALDTAWFIRNEGVMANGVIQLEQFLNDFKLKINDEKTETDSCQVVLNEKIFKAILLIEKFKTSHKYEVLPAFKKTMVIYTKLTDWLYNEPMLITRSYTVSKDMRQIKIYIKEKGSDTKQLYDVINIKMTRGFKIDVSGGLFVSGLYDSKFTLYSKDSIYTSQFIKYDSVPTISDTLKTGRFTAIYPQDNSKISFGGMVYLNAHSQNACFWNYGVYLGIGALFNDQTRWTGSMGGSIILGRSQRFIIHFGVALAQVTRLSEPYKTRVFYEKTFDEIPTINVWKPSYLVGFAWQIGK